MSLNQRLRSILRAPASATLIAISAALTAAYSNDHGETWIGMNQSRSTPWTAACYGAGRFVMVSTGPSNIAAYSDNGINWTESTLPLSKQWLSVAHDGTAFVACCESGLARSTDGGQTWALTSSVINMSRVMGFPGKFMAVGFSVYLTSTDGGATWASYTTPTPGDVANEIAFNGTTYVLAVRAVVGGKEAGWSTDGVNWTFLDMPGGTQWGSVAWNGTVFCMMPTNGASTLCATSPDGVTWTSRTLPASGSWSRIVWDGTYFLTFAEGGASITEFARSTDGINWELKPFPGSRQWAAFAVKT